MQPTDEKIIFLCISEKVQQYFNAAVKNFERSYSSRWKIIGFQSAKL